MGTIKRAQSRLIIIKLGGSVVTFKDSPIPKARISVIQRLSKEISEIYKQGFRIILVHGAGSFGHPLAKKYNLTQGLKDELSCIGFTETTQAMLQLNQIITQALQKKSLPAISLPPHAFMTQTNNKLNNFNTILISDFIKKDFVPVLYGDPVIDTKIGCSILSGDVIITNLAKKLMADKVIFLTDVDGIFSDDPKKNPRAKLFKNIRNKNLQKVLYALKPSGRDDVTGEMKGKILSIKNAGLRCPVIIANGLKPNNLIAAALGKQVGTKLNLD